MEECIRLLVCNQSICNFLSNPTGDAPWEEDADAADVIHANSREVFISSNLKITYRAQAVSLMSFI